jgi:hypothetical protein
LKSQTFGKSLETFGSQIYFLRFLNPKGWYGFFYEFLVVFNLFHQNLSKKLIEKATSKENEKGKQIPSPPERNIDLKTYSLERNPRL